ncbi:hypothetical protein [Mycobacterium sp. 48b]|uniref:hypothetical protein n=1 Tax=Mycobacterium sp. 48b TaxID=3400426 RepID=UPI003AAED51C
MTDFDAAEDEQPAVTGAHDVDSEQEQVEDRVRAAVVIVHGMGEQRPLDTLRSFVQTALTPLDGGWRYYYSRPATVTRSYEARRYIARQLNGQAGQVQTEIFEYHWSYMMTGNRLSDLFASTTRLLVRRVRHVPPELFGIWRIAWAAIALIPVLLLVGYLMNRALPGWLTAILSSAVVIGVVTLAAKSMGNWITGSFVDVVRYLDTSPRSYSARRKIRGGLVDLLRSLHDTERYTRIVVVAHSLGAYIGYDAMSSLWTDLHQIHSGPPGPLPNGGKRIPLDGLAALQQAADDVLDSAAIQDSSNPTKELNDRVDRFRNCQFDLWKGLRSQGNPWRITDFVTVGTPMYLADILLTRPGLFSALRGQVPTAAREEFDAMTRRGELVRCPPRSETQPVENMIEPTTMKYGWRYGTRQVLGSQSLFAVVRWTNMWFPVTKGSVRGDFFGGPLRPLFGPGIRDIPVTGNVKGRQVRWGRAHTRYFGYPSAIGDHDIATHIRRALNLDDRNYLVDALEPDPNTSMTPPSPGPYE